MERIIGNGPDDWQARAIKAEARATAAEARVLELERDKQTLLRTVESQSMQLRGIDPVTLLRTETELDEDTL
jgi:hypothetical protein